MSDLVTWLRQQFEWDERDLSFAYKSPLGSMSSRWWHQGSTMMMTERRARDELAAKRRILDELWNHEAGFATEHTAPRTAQAVLRLLALPYADRPGYRDEWKP